MYSVLNILQHVSSDVTGLLLLDVIVIGVARVERLMFESFMITEKCKKEENWAID